MKRALNIIVTAALCAAILMGLIATANGAAANVYQMAVNDTPLEMTAGNMPMTVGGTLYVPYIMLSGRTTGINLGVSAQYNSSRRTLTVGDGQRVITFDLQNNTAYDSSGASLSVRAAARNAMVFLPIVWLCDYFGTIHCSLTYTQYGTLVRVTNSAVILTDAEYVDAANNLLANNYDRYMESIRPPATPTPQPTQPPRPPATSQPPPPRRNRSPARARRSAWPTAGGTGRRRPSVCWKVSISGSCSCLLRRSWPPTTAWCAAWRRRATPWAWP